MSNLVDLTISESLEKLKNKEISPVELTKAYVEQMEENKKLNAYVTSTAEQALEQAKESEQRYLNGTNRPLEGIALGVKDLFCTKGVRTTACSNILIWRQGDKEPSPCLPWVSPVNSFCCPLI